MREPIVNIAVNAALAAGKIILNAMDRLDTVKISEKNPNDFVTDIDQKCEQEIIKIIHKAHPDHGILGEEGGEDLGKNTDYLWIIDPIDGTRNFIHGFPHFAVSIAISYRGKIDHGVIYDPVRQEMFSASRGKGARLNNQRIRVAQRKQLEGCLLGTGFSYRHSPDLIEGSLDILRSVLPLTGDVRRAGAATLDLAYVACGRLDGYWEVGLKPWDIAAGSILIKEAGGMITDLDTSENYLKSGNVICGNPKILKLLLKSISKKSAF